ncbi:MAG: hypothetical protein OEV40_25505, partial [Acidimicrobiia bacterium]|nr:hypothetical protein [Acidimicrobiia bacterium]
MMAQSTPWDSEQQPAVWDVNEYYDDQPVGRREQRLAKVRKRAQDRETRWQRNRLAVPYRTDGPKITFGIIWFVVVVTAILNSPLVLAGVLSLVAGLAGLQVGYAWFPEYPPTKWWTGLAAFVAAVGGLMGPLGLGAGCALGLVLLLIYILTNPVHHRSFTELLDVLVRASIPVGVAAASLTAVLLLEPGAALSLVVLISAYETGDFLVGSGSSNAVEGPISGLVGLGAALFILWVVAPAPFTDRSMVLFGALAAVCCPLGQILASGLLPRGDAWAP